MSLATTDPEAQALSEVADRLLRRYEGRHDRGTVASVIEAVHRSLDGSRIRTYVPVLVEQMARQALDDMSRPGRQTGGA